MSMYTLLQIPDIPVALGPLGTILAGLVILLQTAMAFYSWRQSSSVKILKEELDITKGKVGRLEGDITKLKEDEEACRGKLDKLTALYLESKGKEEDERKPRRK